MTQQTGGLVSGSEMLGLESADFHLSALQESGSKITLEFQEFELHMVEV